MKTSWVLTEEERKLKFAGKGKKRKDRVTSSVSQSECTEPPSETAPPMPSLGLCDSDLLEIQNFVVSFLDFV